MATDEKCPEKPGIPESAGAESLVVPSSSLAGPPETWGLLDLFPLSVRVPIQRPRSLASLLLVGGILMVIPGAALAGPLLSVAVVVSTLGILDAPGHLSTQGFWPVLWKRGGTLFRGFLLAGLMYFVPLQVAFWFYLSGGLADLGPTGAILFGILTGGTVLFLHMASLFLAAVIVDSRLGARASLRQAIRLFLGFLPGNLLVSVVSQVAMLAGVFLGASLPRPANLSAPFWMALGIIWGQTLVALRYRQIQVRDQPLLD